jgi:hypothetical protein
MYNYPVPMQDGVYALVMVNQGVARVVKRALFSPSPENGFPRNPVNFAALAAQTPHHLANESEPGTREWEQSPPSATHAVAYRSPSQRWPEPSQSPPPQPLHIHKDTVRHCEATEDTKGSNRNCLRAPT